LPFYPPAPLHFHFPFRIQLSDLNFTTILLWYVTNRLLQQTVLQGVAHTSKNSANVICLIHTACWIFVLWTLEISNSNSNLTNSLLLSVSVLGVYHLSVDVRCIFIQNCHTNTYPLSQRQTVMYCKTRHFTIQIITSIQFPYTLAVERSQCEMLAKYKSSQQGWAKSDSSTLECLMQSNNQNQMKSTYSTLCGNWYCQTIILESCFLKGLQYSLMCTGELHCKSHWPPIMNSFMQLYYLQNNIQSVMF